MPAVAQALERPRRGRPSSALTRRSSGARRLGRRRPRARTRRRGAPAAARRASPAGCGAGARASAVEIERRQRASQSRSRSSSAARRTPALPCHDEHRQAPLHLAAAAVGRVRQMAPERQLGAARRRRRRRAGGARASRARAARERSRRRRGRPGARSAARDARARSRLEQGVRMHRARLSLAGLAARSARPPLPCTHRPSSDPTHRNDAAPAGRRPPARPPAAADLRCDRCRSSASPGRASRPGSPAPCSAGTCSSGSTWSGSRSCCCAPTRATSSASRSPGRERGDRARRSSSSPSIDEPGRGRLRADRRQGRRPAPHARRTSSSRFVTVVGSWLLLPMLFGADLRRRVLRPRARPRPRLPRRDREGFEPDHTDFLYFSFTIAVTAQTSDVGGDDARRCAAWCCASRCCRSSSTRRSWRSRSTPRRASSSRGRRRRSASCDAPSRWRTTPSLHSSAAPRPASAMARG